MATGILLHSYTDSLSSSSPHSSLSSSSSSNTSFTSNNGSASTSKPSPASLPHRRIRFAPLPDPRRAVLITDDGDELPIAVSPDDELKCIPASLLVQSPPASPLPRTNEIRNEPSDDRENSSGSSTNSYLSSSSSTSASSASTPRTTTPSDASPLSSLTSSPVTTNSALPAAKCTPPLLTSQNPPSSWPKPRSISLLRPFKRSSASSSGSSSHSLTPTPSIEATQGQGYAHTARKGINLSPEEILTLGAINLFRTSSRESTDSTSTATNSGWGLGLSRWTSANGTDKSASVLNGSSPLSRTQSTQSYKSKSKFFPSTSSLASEPKSVSQPAHSNVSRHKGTRMLNGRVYGSKRPSANANHFASARDTDDEFVEWGYGGMGSVKGAKSAGMAGSGGVNWERLHGGAGVNGRAPKQGVGGAAAAAASADDDDDGSGMGWVKRRREERERKKKEEEEKAAKEKEKETLQVEEEVTESKMSTPTPTRTSTMEGGMFIAEEKEPEDPTSAATVVPASFVEETDEKEKEVVGSGELKEGFVFGGTIVDEPEQEREREHAPVVVPVLMRPRHHHHSSSHRHGRSMSGSGIKPAGSKEVLEEETAAVPDREEAVVAEVHHDSKRESVSSLSTSESEDDTDDDEEEDEGGDERDDDEDDEEEESRKTALGAGVEKVSRHKE